MSKDKGFDFLDELLESQSKEIKERMKKVKIRYSQSYALDFIKFMQGAIKTARFLNNEKND